jgi:hypothetical protein
MMDRKSKSKNFIHKINLGSFRFSREIAKKAKKRFNKLVIEVILVLHRNNGNLASRLNQRDSGIAKSIQSVNSGGLEAVWIVCP